MFDVTPSQAARRFAATDDLALGEAVVALVESARASDPELRVDAAAFAERLGRLSGGDLERARALALPDLWLAFATTAGCTVAMKRFETDVFGPRVAALRRRFDAELVEDVAQTLRMQLVTGDAPTLASYRGRGTLQGWVSIALARAAAKQRARRMREAPSDVGMLAEVIAAEADLAALSERADAKAVLTAALRHAIGELDARPRLLLKLHVCDGLSIDDIARLDGIHRATAARRLERARQALGEKTREHLAEGYRLTTPEIDSLLQAVRSSFVSLMQSFLRDEAEPPPG